MIQNTFKAFNDAEIKYMSWNYQPSQKTMIVMHRGHEHAARMQEFAQHPNFNKFSVFSFDMRGHGSGDVKVSGVFMDYVRDLDCFVKYLHTAYNIPSHDIFIVANSISGVIVSAWVHDYAPSIAGMVLLAPAFEIKLYVPFAKEFIALGTKLNKNLEVKSYVKSKVLTHDVEQQKLYDADPIITKSINGKMLVDFLNSGKRIVEDAAAIDTPTLLLSAGTDYVVKNKTQKTFFIRLSSKFKEFQTLKDYYHGILFEKEREKVYDKILSFANQCFLLATSSTDLYPEKFTLDEYYDISLKMLPILERWNFAFQKFMLNGIGNLSDGMAIGLKYGFDSGISLDYVYKNKVGGKSFIGKQIDNGYLNAIGWRGIRIRKQHLLDLLYKQIDVLISQDKAIHILDIAGGTGNYLFDIKDKYPTIQSIVINDIKQSNIDVGEKRIKDSNYTNIRFTNYSCFDQESFPKMQVKPNIIIISGIFELFSDNHLLDNAIKGVKSIADKDAVIIYTGQPWHPQLKQIACVLKSHQDKDWVMRRRSQNELDKVFKYNGIYKTDMLMDDFGIFSVNVANIGIDRKLLD